MTGQGNRIDDLADRVISADLVAQESVPAHQKPADRTAIPLWEGVAAEGAGRNWILIGLVAIVAIGLIGIGIGYAILGGQQPQPTAVAIPPAPTATSSPVTGTPVVTTPEPTTTATPTATATATATPSAEPAALAEQPGVAGAIDAISNGTIQVPATIPFFGDALGSVYLPRDGSPATQDMPWIDMTGASVFQHALTDGQAVALSSHACGSQGERQGVTFLTSCNQQGPIPAGDYLVFVTTRAAGLPEPFPQTAQCVFIVQSDVDNNAATGFQSTLPFNHLIGADVYYETLFFYSQAGEFKHYILATDHSQPPRPDTGDVHGNLATFGRSWALMDGAGYAGYVAAVPVEHWGENWSAGGFCNMDRAATSPDNFGVDALGEPSDEDFPFYVDLSDVFFPPRD